MDQSSLFCWIYWNLIDSKNQAPIGPGTTATLLGISRRWRTQKRGALGWVPVPRDQGRESRSVLKKNYGAHKLMIHWKINTAKVETP